MSFNEKKDIYITTIMIVLIIFVCVMSITVQTATIKNYSKPYKFLQKPKLHIRCFDYKIGLRPFTSYNGATLTCIKFRPEKKLKIIYFGKTP